MSEPTTPAGSGGSSSHVFTRAQRQVLAFLFLHGRRPVPRSEITGSAHLGMGGAAGMVLNALKKRGHVFETSAGWELSGHTRELMQLGAMVGGLTSLEGVRHVL